MVGVLAEEGLLKVTRVAGAGNRRHLELTAKGAALVKRASRLLEGRFAELVKRSGVSYVSHQRDTRRLLSQLDAETQTAPSHGRAA
jgi:DNA-binding MarR family transcriptional regulator